jgi:hypothetical protein
MASLIRVIRYVTVLLGVALVSSFSTNAVWAQEGTQEQTGTVRLHVVKAGFIVGVGGGHGTLLFRGNSYPLSVGGVSLGSLGIAGADLTGTAHNLRQPADIVGTYHAAGAGGAFVGGAAVAHLVNNRGVLLDLRGVQIGFQVHLGLAGLSIAMAHPTHHKRHLNR